MTLTRGMIFRRDDVHAWARNLHCRMSLERAGRMCGVSAGQVARWRDGHAFTDRSARAAAIGWAADELGMVGTFGRVDTGGARITAKILGGSVAVEIDQSTATKGVGE